MISLIFLAGGSGSRMGAQIPKQFLPLGDKIVACHSFDLFASTTKIDQMVVVCEPAYRQFFKEKDKPLTFALPGLKRQDSVYHGLKLCDPKADLILIHDAARPFIESTQLAALIETGLRIGAAALAVPVSSTIKECDPLKMVKKTLSRSGLWEMQTPQALWADLLHRGFQLVKERGLEVTDDVAIAEVLGHPVEIVAGSPKNLKLTTPFDLAVAQTLLRK